MQKKQQNIRLTVHACNPSPGEVETGEPLALIGQPVYPISELQFQRESRSQKISCSGSHLTLACGHHMPVYTHEHTQTHEKK